ncbi:MAG: hypothetical protein WBP56_06940 [Polyangia bacterium]
MKDRRMILMGAVILLAAGCGYNALYRPSGSSPPVQSVQVRIAESSCCEVEDEGCLVAKIPDENRRVFDLKLQIQNNSDDKVARFSEGQLRLVDSSRPALPALRPDDTQSVPILPGETKELRVRFTISDDRGCYDDFELALSTVRIPVIANSPHASLGSQCAFGRPEVLLQEDADR